jgi:hypothetical protein
MVMLERDWEQLKSRCSTWKLDDGFWTDGTAEQTICEQMVVAEFVSKGIFNVSIWKDPQLHEGAELSEGYHK